MLKPLAKVDLLTLAVLLMAIAAGGWKVAQPRQAASFSSPPKSLMSKPVQQRLGEELSPDGSFRFDSQFVSAAPGQSVHAASMVELASGDLRAVWFSGSREGARDVTLQTAVLDVETGKWSSESTVIETVQLQRGLHRYIKKLGNPVIGRATDGSLWLWLVNVSLGGWAGSSISWIRSTDEGASWSRPKRLVTSPFLNISTLPKGAPVLMTDGSIALPTYHEFFTKFAEIVRLDSSGKVVDKIRIPGSHDSLQPVVIAIGSHDAQVYMRSGSNSYLMSSTTSDAGQTWAMSQPTSLRNPDSALAGLASYQGTQWLALNPGPRDRQQLALIQAQPGGRFDGQRLSMVEDSTSPATRLSRLQYEGLLGQELRAAGVNPVQVSAYVSSAMRQLCNAQDCLQEYSYPYLLKSRDGLIHLIYTWHRTRIKHLSFDPSQPALAIKAEP
jgi:predicted neuraminidase